MLSLEELALLANSSSSQIAIDFSSISVDLLPQLEDSLLHHCVSSITSLKFSAALFDAYEIQYTNGDHGLPPELEGSIYVQFPSFRSEFAALLSRILTRARKLRKLVVHSIKLSYLDIDVICQGLSVCPSLRELSFCRVPLFDEGFQRLSQALFKQGVRKLQCRHCRLSDAIAPGILSLLKFHTSIQRAADQQFKKRKKRAALVCLHNFDFRENRFTPAFLRKITQWVTQSPTVSFDLRGCAKIPPSTKVPQVFALGGVAAKKLTSRQKLEEENRRLTKRVDTLIGNNKVAVVARNLFLVGERATELAERLDELDSLCERLEQEMERTK
jgi:hypothetical protein